MESQFQLMKSCAVELDVKLPLFANQKTTSFEKLLVQRFTGSNNIELVGYLHGNNLVYHTHTHHHTPLHSHMHTHTHSHICTHSHTHTHTHTSSYLVCIYMWFWYTYTRMFILLYMYIATALFYTFAQPDSSTMQPYLCIIILHVWWQGSGILSSYSCAKV